MIRIGLRTKLILLVSFAVLPAIGVIGYTGLGERRYAATTAQKDAMSVVQLAVREQQHWVANARQLLHALAKLPELSHPSPIACHQTLAEVHRLFPHYRNIGMALPNGEVFCRALPSPVKNNIADRGYFQRAMQTRDFGIGDFQIGRASGKNSLNMGQAVLDARGEVQAVLYVALDLGWLSQLISTYDLPPDSILYIIDGKGTILASSADINAPAGQSISQSDLFKIILANDEANSGELFWPDGRSRFYAYAPLHRSPSGKAYVAVGLAKEVVLAKANVSLLRNMTILLIVAAIGFIAAWFGSERLVVRPIRAIVSATGHMTRGQYSGCLDLRPGDQEYRTLTSNIAELAATMRSMSASLLRANRALKVLVDVSKAIAGADNERTLASTVCGIMTTVGRYHSAWIGYPVHDARKSIQPVAESGFVGGMQSLLEMMSKASWAEDERGRGLAGTAIRTRRPYVSQDVLDDRNISAWRDQAAIRNIGAGAAIPFVVDDSTSGVLTVYAAQSNSFDVEELDLLIEVCRQLAFGMVILRERAELSAGRHLSNPRLRSAVDASD